MNQPQQQIPPQATAEEIGARWGQRLTQADILIITLEKELSSRDQIIAKMTENEQSLIEQIQDLAANLAMLKSKITEMNGQSEIHLSEDAAKIAAEGSDIIKGVQPEG